MFPAIYALFTIARILAFPEQIFWRNFELNLLGLVGIIFFGFTIKVIDDFLDKKYPFERNIYKRIFLQFVITFLILAIFKLVGYTSLIKLMPHVSKELWLASFAVNLFMVLSIILSIFGFHFFKRWNEQKILAAELEKEKALVQYDNLKNQLNPHFLFNSLTSLNSLIFENPQLASDFLQQLSKVYRYVLDNKEKNIVSIETEINFVKHYVQLLKARFEDGLEVSFNVDDAAVQKAIVPVTLQILLENAMKHNIMQKDTPLRIKIYNEEEFLVVENNFQKKNVIDISNGQGLENLKNLYHYLSEKPVEIEMNDRSFKVKIPLL